MNYEKMILKMLKKIKDDKKLKKIYDYVCFIFLKGGN